MSKIVIAMRLYIVNLMVPLPVPLLVDLRVIYFNAMSLAQTEAVMPATYISFRLPSLLTKTLSGCS
jgi:hypothetical protein